MVLIPKQGSRAEDHDAKSWKKTNLLGIFYNVYTGWMIYICIQTVFILINT